MLIEIFQRPTFDSFVSEKITGMSRGKYNMYLCSAIKTFQECKSFFPSLYLTLAPTTYMSEISIQGWLCDKEVHDILMDSKINKFEETIFIYGLIPLRFLDVGIIIHDRYHIINRNRIVDKYKHFNDGNQLCTHLKEEWKLYNEKMLSILVSAFRITIEYKNMQYTGEFNLNSFSHGLEGKQEFFNGNMREKTKLRRTKYGE